LRFAGTLDGSSEFGRLRIDGNPQSALQNLGFGQDASGFFSPYANFLNDFGAGQSLNQAIRPFPQFFGWSIISIFQVLTITIPSKPKFKNASRTA